MPPCHCPLSSQKGHLPSTGHHAIYSKAHVHCLPKMAVHQQKPMSSFGLLKWHGSSWTMNTSFALPFWEDNEQLCFPQVACWFVEALLFWEDNGHELWSTQVNSIVACWCTILGRQWTVAWWHGSQGWTYIRPGNETPFLGPVPKAQIWVVLYEGLEFEIWLEK